MQNTSRVVCIGLEAYWDSNCTESVDVIDWGIMQNGENKTITVWLKNVGNEAGNLTANTTDWSPQGIEEYVDVSYTFGSLYLEPAEVTYLNITVSIDVNIPLNYTSFSFSTVIYLSVDVP